MPGRSLPLSLLIDEIAAEGPRDEAFVRAFAACLAARRAHLELPIVERLGISDVVVTFVMKRRVRLVITGTPPAPFPGEVTVSVDERDFPFVDVVDHEAPRDAPYSVCTLDHSVAGRTVRVLATGALGRLVASATIDGVVEHRVALDGEVVSLGADAVAPA